MSLPHYIEAARIYTVINHVDKADSALRKIARTEEDMRQIGIARAEASLSAPSAAGTNG